MSRIGLEHNFQQLVTLRQIIILMKLCLQMGMHEKYIPICQIHTPTSKRGERTSFGLGLEREFSFFR